MSNFVTVADPIIDTVIALLLWLSTLLQVAILRDRSMRESKGTHSARWLVAAGFFGMALRFSQLLLSGGDVPIPPLAELPLALMAMGNIGMCLERLRRAGGERRNRRSTDPWGPSKWGRDALP